jgi:rRNA processing protein Gar1
LKSLGSESFATSSGYILIRSKNIPSLYSTVKTREEQVVGKVNDVIGPIMDPHILVRPAKDFSKKLETIGGKELFAISQSRVKKRDRKWKKKK